MSKTVDHVKKIISENDIRGKVEFNYNLSKLSWFGVAGKAEVFYMPDSSTELALFLSLLPTDVNRTVIGMGSNLLIRDGGFRGIVFKLGKSFNQLSITNNKIIAGASILDSNLSKFAFMNSIKNLEFYSSIPGSIGGAVKMNAGCYGYETKDVISKVTLINEKGDVLSEIKQKHNTK